MKTKTFKQIIDRLIEKGVDSIKITRSDRHMGCIKPNDIIAIEVKKGDEYIAIASVAHVFTTPTIDVDRIVRNEKGRCISRFNIGQFYYSI